MLSLLTTLVFASEPSSEPSPPPIVNGSITLDFVQVGAIMAFSEDYGGMSFCSGTLIDEMWVATAAHCIEAVEEYAGYGMEIYFLLGHSLYSEDGVEYYDTVAGWEMHPEYSGTSSMITSDIGLLELTVGITEVEPVPLNQEVPTELWVGEYLDYVGWGVTSDSSEDSGRKRTTAIPFNSVDETFIYSYDPETNLCSGDSGGAALRWTEEGYTLVGVNSFVFSVQGSQPCEGGASGAVRIDAYYDWIRQYVPEPPPPEPEVTEEEAEKDKMMCATSSGGTWSWWVAMAVVFGLRGSRTVHRPSASSHWSQSRQ